MDGEEVGEDASSQDLSSLSPTSSEHSKEMDTKGAMLELCVSRIIRAGCQGRGGAHRRGGPGDLILIFYIDSLMNCFWKRPWMT